jgi:hypothetical protein
MMPEPIDPQRNESILAGIEPFRWDNDEATNYEVALDIINHAVGFYSSLIAREEAKEAPDDAAIAGLLEERAGCVRARQDLDPTDHDKVAHVRREYRALIRSLEERLRD